MHELVAYSRRDISIYDHKFDLTVSDLFIFIILLPHIIFFTFLKIWFLRRILFYHII
jgi:hypothetical protein